VTDSFADATIAGLQADLNAGRASEVELVRHHLDRIDRLDRRGTALNAVIELNPDAEADAGRLAAERSSGRVRGPLHGIPFLIKDNLDTADRMHTTNGSTVMLGSRPSRDATTVARLRAAGAILLGKTNKTSWTSGSAGWSPRGGQCRNPYAPDRSPHGSSSGSAVGVAAGLCTAALGTETVGSILGPAAANAVVGVKPTTGLTSRAGMIPGIRSFDSIGPLCRTVADAATVLTVLAGPDPLDEATAAGRGREHGDYRDHLAADGLRGARIGVPRAVFFGYSPAADKVADAAIEAMRAAGAEIVDHADIDHAGELTRHPAIGLVVAHETRHYLDRYLAETPGDHPRSVPELVAANRAHADVELARFGQDMLEMLAGFDADLDAPVYREALSTVQALARDGGIDATLRRHGLDALVMPTCPPPWPIDPENGDPAPEGAAVVPGVAGYPAISVPAGFSDGLPVGITFTAGAFSEPTLFRLAYAFEQICPARRPPRL
jgi:amidase